MINSEEGILTRIIPVKSVHQILKSKVKMSPIKSILISNIMPVPAESIAQDLFDKEIAKVSKITIQPYLNGDTVMSYAYVLIKEWCDTEAAYDFIQQLTYGPIYWQYADYEPWLVQINTHNDGDLDIYPYTVYFNQLVFYESEHEYEEEHEYESEHEYEEEEEEVRLNTLKKYTRAYNKKYTEDLAKKVYEQCLEASLAAHDFEKRPLIEMYSSCGDSEMSFSIEDAKDRINYLECCLRDVAKKPEICETSIFSREFQLCDFYEDQRSNNQNNFFVNQEIQFLQKQIDEMYEKKASYEAMLDKAVANSRHVTVRGVVN